VSNLILDKETVSGTLSTDGLETLLPPQKLEELKRLGKGPHRFVAARGRDPLPPPHKLEQLNRLGDGPHRFVAARVEDPGLVAELEQANVKSTGHVENLWLSTLLSWILPPVVFA